MNEIQNKINSELRRPNAGASALCNVVADVAEEIVNNAGGGTSIPVLKVLRVEEVTIEGSTNKVVIFDDASNEILDNLVGNEYESSEGDLISRAVSMDAESLSLITGDSVITNGSLVGTAMLASGSDEVINNYIFLLPFITIIRYIEASETPEDMLNRWIISE